MQLEEAFKLDEIKKHTITSKIGIYFMYDCNHELVYIGRSNSIIKRVYSHRNKSFRFYKYIECKKDELGLLEKYYIKKYKPKLNRLFNDSESVKDIK